MKNYTNAAKIMAMLVLFGLAATVMAQRVTRSDSSTPSRKDVSEPASGSRAGSVTPESKGGGRSAVAAPARAKAGSRVAPTIIRKSSPVQMETTCDDTLWDQRFSLPSAGKGLLSGHVNAVAVDASGNVYIGGLFTQVGTVNARNVAKWNGSNWQALGVSPDDGVNGEVFSIAVFGTNVYIGGSFTGADDGGAGGPVSANKVAVWNSGTATWASLGDGTDTEKNGTDGTVYALTVSSDGTSLYVGGGFTNCLSSTGTVLPYSHLAKWSTAGMVWNPLGDGLASTDNGVNGTVYALALNTAGTQLHAGGSFTATYETGGLSRPLTNVATWIIGSATWSALGVGIVGTDNGTNGTVRALGINSGNLYLGGDFTFVNGSAGSLSANHIAVWDGSTWANLGTTSGPTGNGVSGSVRTLTVLGTRLYVGGTFATGYDLGASATVTNVAAWDLTALATRWSKLGNGTLGNGVSGAGNMANALAGHGNDLYVGGDFSTAGCNPSIAFGRYAAIAGPSITGITPFTRQEGQSYSATIATAYHPTDLLQTLTVEISDDGSSPAASATKNNITISNLAIDSSGNVAALVTVPCSGVTLGVTTFVIHVTDSGTNTATATLSLTVSAGSTGVVSGSIAATGSTTVTVGDTVTLQLTSANATNVQWQISVNGGLQFNDLSGERGSTLTFVAKPSNNGNKYRAVLSNCSGAAAVKTNEITLTVSGGASPLGSGLVISEFRLRGPGGSMDEFIDIQNITNSDIVVQATATDSVKVFAYPPSASRITVAVLPDITIPAAGHYLLTNLTGYSLGTIATGDDAYLDDIPDGSSLALVAITGMIGREDEIDVVGYGGIHIEGTALPASVTTNEEHSWVRKKLTGIAQDTDNNASDFVLVSTVPLTVGGTIATLGAPGPQDSFSLTEALTSLSITALDPACPSNLAVCPGYPSNPNWDRDVGATAPLVAGYGTLKLRRSYTNLTALPIKALTLRILNLTNSTIASADAEVHVLTSSSSTQTTSVGSKSVEGMTLNAPTQTYGGGVNSRVTVGGITPATPLAPGATVNVEIKLGVQRLGRYSLLYMFEIEK